MNPPRFPLGAWVYRPRHVRPGVRWWLVVLLLGTAAAIRLAGTPAGMAAVPLVVVAGLGRWRLVRAAARLERILGDELRTHAAGTVAGRVPAAGRRRPSTRLQDGACQPIDVLAFRRSR